MQPITVTFDVNGGKVNKTSKRVVYNQIYGELPTPTREGYEFMGWNGKNMFTGLVKGKGLNSNNGAEINNINAAVSDYIPISFNLNNNYYLSGLTNTLNSYIAAYNENKEFIGRSGGDKHKYISFNSTIFSKNVSGIEGDIKYIRITQYKTSNNSGTIEDINNIQIQLKTGTKATTYEPYYIISSTTVVQGTNHPLKAIWQDKEE